MIARHGKVIAWREARRTASKFRSGATRGVVRDILLAERTFLDHFSIELLGSSSILNVEAGLDVLQDLLALLQILSFGHAAQLIADARPVRAPRASKV